MGSSPSFVFAVLLILPTNAVALTEMSAREGGPQTISSNALFFQKKQMRLFLLATFFPMGGFTKRFCLVTYTLRRYYFCF